MPNPRCRTFGLRKGGRQCRSADSRPTYTIAKATFSSTAVLAALSLGLSASTAHAIEFSSGGVYGSVDTTVSHGILYRIENPDPDQLSSANGNDGNYNYERGIVSNVSKFTTDFSLETDANDFSAFARITGFYDFENSKSDRARTPLSDAAKSAVGSDVELLDLYGTWATDVAGMPVDLRLGQFVLNWGESTYIQNGINVINPYDVSKLRLPGSELREGLLPVAMAAATVYPSDSLSIEGFVQLDWEPTKIDPVGTFFSTVDHAGAGAEKTFVALPGMTVTDQGLNAKSKYGLEDVVAQINEDFAAVTPNPITAIKFPDPDFMTLRRTADQEPGNKGQYGLAARLFAERLNDTEFGVYFIRYHNRLPVVSAMTAPATAVQAGLAAANAVSATGSNTQAQVLANVTTQVTDEGKIDPVTEEAAFKKEVSDRVKARMKLIATVVAVDTYSEHSRYFLEYPKDQTVFGLSFNTLLGSTGWAVQGEMSFRPDVPLQRAERIVLGEGLSPITTALEKGYDANYEPGVIQGYIERSVTQLQATATKSFGPMIGSDGGILLAELGVLHIHDMPDAPIESPADGTTENRRDADANSFGYRLATRMDYHGAVGAVNLFPYAQYQHDFRGNSPSPIGPFVEGRKGLTLGVKADYISQWEFDAGVSFMWGDGNDLRDRDFFYSSIKYSF